jgi:hypothetical protein
MLARAEHDGEALVHSMGCHCDSYVADLSMEV